MISSAFNKLRNIFSRESKQSNQPRNDEEFLFSTLQQYTWFYPDIINIINNSIVVISGRATLNDFTPSVIFFDELSQEWGTLPPIPTPRACFGTVVFYNQIYTIGGWTKSSGQHYNCEMFDCSTNQWQIMPKLVHKRSFCTACLYREKIYCIGGFNGNSQQTTVEMYDPCSSFPDWSVCKAKMNLPRAGCAAVDFNDTMYVLGGYDGNKSGFRHHTVEYYDPINDKWLYAMHLTFGRTVLSAVASPDYLFVMGGYDGSKVVPTFEKTDMKTPWITLPSLPEKRQSASATINNNIIYYIGGQPSGGEIAKTAFAFDLNKKNPSWFRLPDIPSTRFEISCVSAPINLTLNDAHLKKSMRTSIDETKKYKSYQDTNLNFDSEELDEEGEVED